VLIFDLVMRVVTEGVHPLLEYLCCQTLFVDDVLIMSKASLAEWKQIKAIIELFFAALQDSQ
jgi:hypothetical protein